MPQLPLIIDQKKRRPLVSLYSDQDLSIADFVFGEVVTISAALADRVDDTESRQLWVPVDLTGYGLRAALGKPSLLPLAGVLTLNNGINTTAALSYQPTAQEVEDALNDLASIIAAGGVEVRAQATNYFFVTFNDVGAQAQIVGDATDLAPVSIIEAGTAIDGDILTREVQTIRIIQRAGAVCDLTTASSAASAAVTVLQVGGGGNNHKVRIAMSEGTYGGVFTVHIGGYETLFIDFDADEADVKAKIEALTSVGSGNAEVVPEAGNSWVISFVAGKANTNMGTITTTSTALNALPTLTGSLDLRVPGVELMMGGNPTTAVTLEIEATPPGGLPYKAMRYATNIVDAVLSPAMTTPAPNFVSDYDHIVAVPANSTAPGLPGDVAYDGNYEYRYTGDGATHAWRRNAHASW